MVLTPEDIDEFSNLLQAHVKNIHRVGTQVTGSVPWREDKHPSFSADTAKGVWYDHAREEGGGIKEFKRRLGLPGKSPSPTRSQLTATYSYQDEAGEELFQVLRFTPRTFKGRRPDGKGGWINNLDNVRRVLYRLPQLATAETVYVVEGEKDADRLWSSGISATTNPHGAGKWREEYSESLRGKHVVILPDNDKPGAEHARIVSRLLEGKALSIKIIQLPGLSEKGDVSDWLNAGHTAEELLDISLTAPILSSREKTTPYTNGHDLSSLITIQKGISDPEAKDLPEFPCPDIIWQGHHAAIADILGLRDWRVWIGITAALSARAHRNLHANYYSDLFGMGYWLLVSGSSTGKSLVTRLCSTLLQPDYRKKYSVESGQGLINLISKSDKDEAGKTVALHATPTILLLSEWSTLLSNMDIRGSSLMEKMNECYDSEHAIEANRTEKQGHNDSASVDNPALTLLGTTTIRTFRSRVKEHHKESGFLNRHFLLPGPMIEWKYNSEHENFPREQLFDYAHHELPRSSTFGLGHPIREMYTPEAFYLDDLWGKDILEPLHNHELDEGIEDGSPYRRLHAYARRIAALLAWSESSDLIQLHHVEATHAVVETSLKFLRWLLTDGPIEMTAWQRTFSEIEEKIIKKIKEKPGIRKDELCKALRKNGGYTAIAERLDKLTKSGGVTMRIEGQKKCLYLAS